MSAPWRIGWRRNGDGTVLLDHQRDAVRMRHLGHRGDVEHDEAGVA